MNSPQLLVDAFGRIRGGVHRAVDGLTPAQLAYRVDAEANSIAWLVWHLTRIQDRQIAGLMGTEELWIAGGWADRFGLPFAPTETGYGHSASEVAAVRADAELLVAYFEAVHARTMSYVGGLTGAELSRIVDASWSPPVTLAVRLVSTLADDLQHAGQASYVRGLAERAGLPDHH